MEQRDRIIKLYDIYKNLLTEKQRTCFEYYYFEDLSLSEISSSLKVSKSFIGKTINKIEEKLEEYDKLLSIYELYNNLEKIKNSTKDNKTKRDLENIIK